MNLLLAATARHVAADGSAVALARRDAVLLAWLAIEGPTPRLRLATLLWPEALPDAAANALRQRLFQLRRQCGRPLVAGAAILSLAEDVVHDLHDADTVLGVESADFSAELAAWLVRVRAQRAERARTRLLAEVDAAEQARDAQRAIEATLRLIAIDPLREDAHRRLMHLHHAAGDRAAALRAFDRLERLLKEELGVSPDGQTLNLLAQIEAGERPVAGGGGSVPASVSRPPRRIGRDAEWAQAQHAWQEGRTVLLSGEGGLGKSRLLGDFAQAHAPGVLVVGARPGDALLPYALLSRLLRAVLARGVVPGEGVRRELARLLPELGDAEPMTPGAERTRFVNAVEATLAQAAADGLRGLLIDDLHLADPASVELLLPWSGDEVPHRRLAWMHAFRDAELPPAFRVLLQDLAASHRALTLALAPLTPAQVQQLLESLGIEGLGGPAQAQALHRHTGGNPLYLLEAVKAQLIGAADSVALAPLASLPAVGQVIQQRIGRLSTDAVRLARCAAVAGQDFSAALAADVLQVAPLDLSDAWQELESAQVLRDCAFAHDLIHEAALASVPAPIAQALHAQIARFLQAHGGDAARIAAHWIASRERLPAVPHLKAVARLAMGRYRYSEAAQACATAAGILEDAGSADEAFDCWFLGAEAVGTLGDAARLAPFAERLDALARSDAQIAKAALVRGNVLIEAGHVDACLQLGERGLQAACRAGLHEIESDLRYLLGIVHWDRRDVALALPLVEDAIRIRRALPAESLRQDHVETMITMVQSYGTILGGAGRVTESMEQVTQAYHLAAAAGLPQAMLGAAADLAVRVSETGDLANALQWAERGALAARANEVNLAELLRLGIARAGALVLAGQWGAAMAQYDELVEREQGTDSRVRADLVARRALMHGLLGRRDLGLKAAQAELSREAITETQRLWLELTLLALGEARDVPALVERVAAVQDVGLRARMLVRLAPLAAPSDVLPLLGVTAQTMRENGLKGLWMTLQARIAAQLAAARRPGEAVAAARPVLAAWSAGVTPTVPEAELAADLRAALAHGDPDQSHALRVRGEGWLQAAASTLPAPWRDNCQARSLLLPPLQAALPAP